MDAFRLSSIRLPLAAISVVKLVKLFSNFENEPSGIIVVRYGDLKIMTLFTCSSFQFHVPVVFQFYGSPVVSEDNKMVKVFTHLSDIIFSNLSY